MHKKAFQAKSHVLIAYSRLANNRKQNVVVYLGKYKIIISFKSASQFTFWSIQKLTCASITDSRDNSNKCCSIKINQLHMAVTEVLQLGSFGIRQAKGHSRDERTERITQFQVYTNMIQWMWVACLHEHTFFAWSGDDIERRVYNYFKDLSLPIGSCQYIYPLVLKIL